MRIEKRYLYLTETEWRVLLLALNKLRSKLITQGRYTDAVDEIIMKMAGYRKLLFCLDILIDSGTARLIRDYGRRRYFIQKQSDPSVPSLPPRA